MMLAAGKTHDVVWTPAAAGEYSVYDRALGLNAPGQGTAGMLARLKVGAAAGGPDPVRGGERPALHDAEGRRPRQRAPERSDAHVESATAAPSAR